MFLKKFPNSSSHCPNTLLGMKVNKAPNKIGLSLPMHIDKCLAALKSISLHAISTPCTPGLQLTPASNKERNQFADLNENFRSHVGRLNHIASLARPDISFAVSNLAQFNNKPGISHWNELIRVWRYLAATKHLKLVLSKKNNSPALICYRDATWGDNPETRRSQTGLICSLFGAPLYWTSRKQRNITFSSTEAECNALSNSQLEARWINHLIDEIWDCPLVPSIHLIDNKGLDDKVKKFGTNSKTKFIDIKTKGLREDLINNKIEVLLVPSEQMVANALTKPASKASIDRLVAHISS